MKPRSDHKTVPVTPAAVRQLSKRRRRASRAVSPAGVPALLPELVIEHPVDGSATLRTVRWPADAPVPPSEAAAGAVDLADLVASVHVQLGTYLRLTVRRADGLVSTEILPPPVAEAAEPGARASRRCLVAGFVAGEETWIAQVVSVESAGEDGVADAGMVGGLTLVIAPSSGRIVLIDPSDDGPPAQLALREGEGGQ